ncbi:Uncharacterised protein [BD1-7 clade bacterium]|uniref:Glycosyltransferase RgtA/B/C/D-like domain-containing protein n=1 Tax=BD1-7 clade bacterium TaxID=2029982 RepID=A0A5S9Q735_9GAMM|nr:Uncharacterised protein [BD1-7 clade bacterium]CAA0114473.1 Uncharacterised protein [BD1-7 clade bacterium]
MLFRHNSFAISTLLGILFAISISRAIQLPNDWAIAQWLINYSHGFVKRGLPGTFFDPWIHAEGIGDIRHQIDAVSLFIFCLMWIGIGLIIRDLLIRLRFGTRAVWLSAAFLLSPMTVLSGELVGYYDSIIMALAMLSLFYVTKGNLWVPAILLSLSMFIHESTLLISFPVVVAAVFLHQWRTKKEDQKTFHWNKCMLFAWPILVVPVVAFTIVCVLQIHAIDRNTVQPPNIQAIEELHIVSEQTITDVKKGYNTSVIHFLKKQFPKLPKRIFRPQQFWGSLVPLLTMIWVLRRLWMQAHWAVSALIFAVMLSPLVILGLAWDVARIHSFAYFTTLAMIWICLREKSEALILPRLDGRSTWLALLVLIIFVINPASLFYHRPENISALTRILGYTVTLLALYACTRPKILRQPGADQDKH